MFADLKARHRRERDAEPAALSLRVHRALSWLGRAEQSADDRDVQFVLLWVAFNAAYAQDLAIDISQSERERLHAFLGQLCRVDEKRFENLLWHEFSGSVRMLLENRYVFQPFWDWRNGRISEADFQRQFDGARRAAERALGAGDTNVVLQIVFHRLYTLRNQLVHGGATWNGDINREQVRDCATILGRFVPLIIATLMDYPGEEWGPVHYPVVS
ncbi:hypothetical protein [Microbacterium dextranolyticum]